MTKKCKPEDLFKVGVRPFYETPKKMAYAIDDYLKTGFKIRKVVVGPATNRQTVDIPIPTITGLCIHLGFESRQSFYDYEVKPEFSYIIKRARLFIENEYEEILTTGNTVGAIFALKNMGWRDRLEHEIDPEKNKIEIIVTYEHEK